MLKRRDALHLREYASRTPHKALSRKSSSSSFSSSKKAEDDDEHEDETVPPSLERGGKL